MNKLRKNIKLNKTLNNNINVITTVYICNLIAQTKSMKVYFCKIH